MADDDKKDDDKKDDKGKGGDTLTQADVDRIVAEADKLKDSDKSESAKLAEQLTQMQKDLDEERRQRRIIEVAAEKGLTPAHVKRLTGNTREELEASADELLEDFPIPKKDEKDDDAGKSGDGKPAPQGKPRENLKPGNGDPDAPVEETDVRKLGERMFRH